MDLKVCGDRRPETTFHKEGAQVQGEMVPSTGRVWSNGSSRCNTQIVYSKTSCFCCVFNVFASDLPSFILVYPPSDSVFQNDYTPPPFRDVPPFAFFFYRVVLNNVVVQFIISNVLTECKGISVVQPEKHHCRRPRPTALIADGPVRRH